MWNKILIWLGYRCKCGGKLEDQGGGYYDECVKCHKRYRN